jgi:hypothetical protein
MPKSLPQVQAWRGDEKKDVSPRSMSPDLDMSLLYRMMRKLGELRAQPNPASTQNFEGLVDTARFERHDEWHRYLSGLNIICMDSAFRPSECLSYSHRLTEAI